MSWWYRLYAEFIREPDLSGFELADWFDRQWERVYGQRVIG